MAGADMTRQLYHSTPAVIMPKSRMKSAPPSRRACGSKSVRCTPRARTVPPTVWAMPNHTFAIAFATGLVSGVFARLDMPREPRAEVFLADPVLLLRP